MITALHSSLRRSWHRQLFDPRWPSLFVHPFYFARKGLHDNIADLAPKIRGRTLDVGCGVKPYESLCRSSAYVGLEIDTPEARALSAADVYYDGTTFPFPDNSFDSLLVNQVFEHVFNPPEFMRELNRVLKLHGHLLMTVPFAWDEHLQPHDYARYSSFGLRHILEANGFEVIELRKSMADVRVLAQLVNAYIYKKTVGPNTLVNILLTVILMAPVNLLGTALGTLLPRNDDLYLDNVVLARKVGSN